MPEKSTNKCYIHFTIITVLGTILSLKLTEKVLGKPHITKILSQTSCFKKLASRLYRGKEQFLLKHYVSATCHHVIKCKCETITKDKDSKQKWEA